VWRFSRTREKAGNNIGTDGRNSLGFQNAGGHSCFMQCLTQLVPAVEPLWLRRGTSNFPVYSHYDEEDLISSKMKKSSRRGGRKLPGLILIKRLLEGMNFQ
jgi:hypothetical protein